MQINLTSIIVVTAIVLSLALAAQAQQSRTFYGSDGRVSGRTHTDSQGATVIYDSGGRVTGRATTSGNTTTLYGADGRRTGTTPRPQRSR